jgi:hypothetical protein
MQPQKLAPTTEVGCGLQNTACSLKSVQKLRQFFFFIFLNSFGNFGETKQGEAICC